MQTWWVCDQRKLLILSAGRKYSDKRSLNTVFLAGFDSDSIIDCTPEALFATEIFLGRLY